MTGWEYMTKKAAVVPFAPGTVVYVDGMLSTLYYKTKETGRLGKVFCGDNPSHDEFIRMFDPAKKVLQILCEVTDQGEPEEKVIPVGYSWVEMPKGVDGNRAALCGFAFFKRSRVMRELGLLGIAYWMKGLKIDVIHGVMLESNLAARNYAEELGFIEVAIVPKYHFCDGKLVGARVMSIEAKDFTPSFDKWFEKNRVANPE